MARRPARDSRAARSDGSLRRSRAVRITARGWMTLGVGALALVVGYVGQHGPVFVVAGAAVLLVVGARIVVRIRQPRFEVERQFHPSVVAAGSGVAVQLRIRNTASIASTPLRWNDAIPWPADAPPHELPGIPTGSARRRTRTAEYDLAPPRRGLYPIGPFVVEYEDAFGMVSAVHALGESDRLVVVPAVVALPEGGPVLADGDGAAQLVQRRVAGNDDDLTTREYRSGDAMRRVHWRASARRGELMVRQEEHRSHPDARILVDTRQDGYADAEPEGETWAPSAHSEAFEWVVRMTASLGVHLEASGFRVSFEETAVPQIEGIGERWEGGRRAEGFLTSLAGIQLVDRPHAPIGDGALAEPDGPLIALLGDPEDAVIEFVLRRRRGGQAATVFLVEARPAAVRRFQDAGWQCIAVAPWSDPAAAWAAAAHAGDLRSEARA